jgi:hypothetical protein
MAAPAAPADSELPRPTASGEQHLVVSDAIFEAIHEGVALTPRPDRGRFH